MQDDKRKMAKGAFVLAVGTFVAKIIGAVYRIPLTAVLKSRGLGLYQMVFPVYAALLDLSGLAVPGALSKLVSEESAKRGANGVREKFLSVSLKIFVPTGLFLSIIMAAFAVPFSRAQGSVDAAMAYVFLSPSVFTVSAISCYRGYFQGTLNMAPTAISQITEQVVKLVFGLAFAFLLMPNVPLAVAGATFAVTLSEAAALIFLRARYKKACGAGCRFPITLKTDKKEFALRAKKLMKVALPVTFIGMVLPLSQIADSFIIINSLKSYSENATSLYGILTGAAASVIGVPVAGCYGFSAVAIPAVSGAKSQAEKHKNAQRAILNTFAFSVVFAACIYAFSQAAVNVLFRSLNPEEKTVAVNLLRLLSPEVVFLSLVQTTNAALIGMGRLKTPVITTSVGVVAKIVVESRLCKNPVVNIYGGGAALIACYFSVCLLNLLALTVRGKDYANQNLAIKRPYGQK